MKLEEIKKAVDEGYEVYLDNTGYQVKKDNDSYVIVFKANGYTIGLADSEGNLNGKEENFFIYHRTKSFYLD